MQRIINFLKQYPFSIVVVVLFFIVYSWTNALTLRDRKDTQVSEKKLDAIVLDSFYFNRCIAKDSSKSASRLMKSIMVLKQRKDNAMDDATYYYECIFIYSHILGIFSILGSLIILLVITKGWNDSSLDLRIALGSVFLICSVSYFIPKLMGSEQNYKDNMATFYNYNKQINYSIKVLSFHCCCDTSKDADKLLIATADSNFTTINNNLTFYYDINFGEAAKYFEEFKSDKIFKK
jgi:hypothetical protein